MNELEKIIVEVRKKYHEKVLWKDGSNYVPTRNCLVEIELEAKAISQYVIKARISDIDSIMCWLIADKIIDDEQWKYISSELNSRIAQLKKGLEK